MADSIFLMSPKQSIGLAQENHPVPDPITRDQLKDTNLLNTRKRQAESYLVDISNANKKLLTLSQKTLLAQRIIMLDVKWQ